MSWIEFGVLFLCLPVSRVTGLLPSWQDILSPQSLIISTKTPVLFFFNLCLQALYALGYRELRIQHGSSPKPQLPAGESRLKLVAFDYKPTLADEMKRADLVVGHAGTVTFQVLEPRAVLLVAPSFN